MRRRSRRSSHATDVPGPTGSEWLSVNDVRVWLPLEARRRVSPDRAAGSYLDCEGPGWAVARSALDFLLTCVNIPGRDHEVGWVKKVGDGLSKETYRAEVTFQEDGKDRYEAFAVSQIH